MNRKEFAFVIPAYNPDEKFLDVVVNIRNKSNIKVFIIDDGSSDESKKVFSKIKDLKDIQIIFLKHTVNLGKGAALKTVFNYILINHPNIEGVVTLDSDGQHLIKDCLQVLEVLKTNDNAFVLGYREFSKDIPLKSYIGNNISKFIYNVVLGKKFKDTQTGLRGINKIFMKECLSIRSNRFEFETEQLSLSVGKYNIIEIPIKTVYIENNKASSFRPLVDSFKIYFVLLRYGLSSIITAIIDFIVFLIALSFGANIIMANILSRTVSIGVQFNLLDKFVFYTQSKWKSFVLFVLYVYIMGIISAWTQINMVNYLDISIPLAKVLVEGILFFVNFAFLRLYIFNKK